MAKNYILKIKKIPKDKLSDKISNSNLSNNKLPKDAFDKIKKNKIILQPKNPKQETKIKLKKFK